MTLRRRLAVWYAAVIVLVLSVALALAYTIHTESHDADIDAGLRDLSSLVEAAVAEHVAAGMPASTVRFDGLGSAFDHPHAAWLLFDGAVVAFEGDAGDAIFATARVTELSEGWHTTWLETGRVRSLTRLTDVGRIVTAADLATADEDNNELRTTYILLAAFAVVVGIAITFGVAGAALRPVAKLTRAAREIADSRDFRRRVNIRGHAEDELVVLGRTFDEMLASLSDAYGQQQRFLSDVSHELRTPLTTIGGHAELLAAGGLSAASEKEAIARIARESSRLSRLVGDLLMLARGEAAETLSPQKVQLDELLMETFDELRPRAAGRLRIRSIAAVSVLGERDRLKQLILALVDNALRYTPAPGAVDASLGEDAGYALLTVEDEGVGIAPGEADRVFERFYRGAAARRLDPSGSGLGLSIVRWIVERHGGSVRLEPRAGRSGTRAVVRLPLA